MPQHTGGLLAQIGRGLQLGAGVLNPEIFAQQQQERAQARLDAKQRQAELAKFILAAAQGGALPSDQAKQALRVIDPALAEQIPDAVLQPGMEAQKTAVEFQQAQQDRADRAEYLKTLGLPAGTPDSVAAAMFRNQSGGAASTLGKLAEDFRAGRISEADYRAAVRKATHVSSTGDDQRERKIQALMAQGLDRARATNIVDRNLDIKINEKTGSVVLTDLVTGSVRELPIASGGERPPIPAGEALYDQVGQGVTGAIPFVAELVSGITGQVGLPVAEGTIERRQALRAAQQDLIRALAVNPRFPVAEMERIRQEVNITPGVLDSDEAMRARMRSIDKSLRIRLAQAERDAGDASLPSDMRSAQAQNAAAIRNFLDRLVVKQESESDDDALIQKYLNQ